MVKDLFIFMEVRGSNFHTHTLWVNLGQARYVQLNEVRLGRLGMALVTYLPIFNLVR